MDRTAFKAAIDEYRQVMKGVAEEVGWASADWLSEVWLAGCGRCLQIVEEWVPRKSEVLDFGCGVGFMTVLLGKSGFRATGIDIEVGGESEEEDPFLAPWGTLGIEKASPTFRQDCWNRTLAQFDGAFHGFDGRHIPFPDASFDAVIAHAVLEHIKPDILRQVIDEFHRVLKESGVLLVLRTPRKASYLEKLFMLPRLRNFRHQILYDEAEVESLVIGAGFCLRQQYVTDMFPAFPPHVMKAYNAVSPLLIRMDGILLRTPLRRYAHHMALVFKKKLD